MARTRLAFVVLCIGALLTLSLALEGAIDDNKANKIINYGDFGKNTPAQNLPCHGSKCLPPSNKGFNRRACEKLNECRSPPSSRSRPSRHKNAIPSHHDPTTFKE